MWFGSRRALLLSLIHALIKHEQIITTVTRAKELRRIVEKLITKAKKGTLHYRRLAAQTITEPAVLQKLFVVLGPRYANRQGGYTRIIRTAPRKGDGAELAVIELLDRPVIKKEKKEKKKKEEQK